MHLAVTKLGLGQLLLLSFIAVFTGADTLAAEDPSSPEMERVMADLRAVKRFSGTFIERKSLGLLRRNLETSGEIRYEAPDRLERRTLKPSPDKFLLEGETISGVQRNGEHYSVSLSERPEIAALVEGIRATLAGDLASLNRHYLVEFEGNSANWSLHLKPRLKTVQAKVSEIQISGEGDMLKRVAIRQTQGDHSEMMIRPEAP